MKDIGERITKPVFLADSFLNLILGLFFIVTPERVDNLILVKRLIPRYVWILIGAGFLYFAYWQIRSFLRERLTHGAFVFSFFMSIIPAILLLVLMVVFFSYLSRIGIVLLTIGDIYMFFLAALYSLKFREEDS